MRAHILEIEGAEIISETDLNDICYHALLVDFPATEVEKLLDHGPEEVSLLSVDDILFLSPAVPMVIRTEDAEEKVIVYDRSPPSDRDPRAALLDGLPLANHEVLQNRLIVEDPEGFSRAYSPDQCCHGTAMASLIVHGDLSNPDTAIRSRLYVEPILEPRPGRRDTERAPENQLFVDVVHAALERLFCDEAPFSKSIYVVNLSIGEPARTFSRRMSPLARLLDYFAVTRNVLFIISAGNHPPHVEGQDGVYLRVPKKVLADPADFDSWSREEMHRKARHRGLLTPAEAINGLTVGATHDDSYNSSPPANVVEPSRRGSIAIYSPSGFGFRRSPKPDTHLPGGRIVFLHPPSSDKEVSVLKPAVTATTGPGILTAAPTRPRGTSGVLYSFGTSNAAALATHNAVRVIELLEDYLEAPDEWPMPGPEFYPIVTKALLVHATSWSDAASNWAEDLETEGKSKTEGRNKRRKLTQHLGFGLLEQSRLVRASAHRATLVGAATLTKNKRRSFRFPLPPSLSNHVGWRRLTVTLAWFSPIALQTQQYRVAHLEFGSPGSQLDVKRKEVDYHANGKGTVLHEVLEGNRAAGYTPNEILSIDVDSRERAGKLTEPVRFALIASLEVGQDVRIDVHNEVRNRLKDSVRARRIRTPARG